MAISSPVLFRYGFAVLLRATENFINGITIKISDSCDDAASQEINLIAAELGEMMLDS
jgi:hypothetical protein